jgi:hypothetical protein
LKLSSIINKLTKEELEEIYSIFWSNSKNCTKEDYKQHIIRYILQFYMLRSKQSCREKCKFLIEEIKYRG